MPVEGFSHYNLRAPRELMEQLREFYCDVVGLHVGYRPPFRSHGYWLYAEEQAVLHLSEAQSDNSDDSPTPARSSTFDHAAFSCSGRESYEALLGKAGIPFRTARVPETTQVQLFFRDPAGNGIELNFNER
jgi:catechol-2,3-dioxygenase